MAAPRHVYLIDGSGFIFRAYHALPPMNRADGTPTNAVYGFTSMLIKLIEETGADHVAVIFDKGRRSFRNDIYPDYKAQRPDAPEDLVPQFPLIREAVRAFNVACVEMEGFEADDLIATYARQATEAGAEVTIVSSDKDLMQLVSDKVGMVDMMKNRSIDAAAVVEKFGVPPDRVIDVQALAGDSVDNVPGVPGIGIKTAAKLIEEYGDLETLLERAHEIKQPKRRQSLIEFAEQARVSRQLVTLRDDVAVPIPLTDFAVQKPERETVLGFLEAQAFSSLLAKITARLDADSPQAARAPVEAAYQTVADLDTLDRWIAEAEEAGVVAVDTETDRLDARGAGLVGVSLATAPGRACYIPLAHRAPAGKQQGALFDGPAEAAAERLPGQLDPAQALARLRPLLADPGVLKVGHNIKYDLHVLAGAGRRLTDDGPLTVSPLDDTMVLSYVLDGTAHGHGMDELAELHLAHKTIPFSQVCGKGKSQISFAEVPLDQATAYAAEDADITLRLYQLLRGRLRAEKMTAVHETLDRPLVGVLTEMEAAGIRVDAAVLKDLSGDFARRMADLESHIHELAGREFNLASPKQLGEVLFDEMGLKGGKKSSKTGAWGTGAEVLETLAAEGHDLPARVLDWRQLAKLKSTYTDALAAAIDPGTGRVHTTFSMTVTSTGRLSSSDPNLQNIPIRTEEGRKIRQAFVASPGHRLISADYSQIELRILAHVAQVEGLKQAFADMRDIHAITAAKVFGKQPDEVDSGLRRQAKAINFGIIYGISAFGLAAQLGIDRGAAKRFIDDYFEAFPEILAYMETTKAFARKRGYVRTPFGRKCMTPGISEKNPNLRGFAERAAINAPIQGGAADIIKRAMIALPGALVEHGLKTRSLLQVHDELVLEAPEDEVDAASEVIRATMEQAASLDVPLIAEVGVGASWASAH
ncbi:DNA polymerase I [Roseospirillum parvum]|uniref:DNA polymerase I n=1 Tax=Roseospirillum parvum TaxID=83401 RepID=A0A1G7TV13_9PROT|nr:DNA polymerase I [Roseospirillum parvum]SDG38579.1 DNA polymerase I [Roseospirillum parvum]